jgi:hypothetical protein
MDDLTRRMNDLERRLAALETSEPATRDRAPDRFWVLDGLRPQLDGSGAVVYGGVVTTPAGPVEWQYGHTADDLLDEGPDELQATASRLAALGHPARLAILVAVLRGRDRVSELADVLELGTSGQVYHHVKALTAAGWLRPATRGRVAVPPERVVPLLVALGVTA